MPLRFARQAILPAIALALSACEKPKLQSDGAKETVEATSADQPVNPFSPPDKTPATPSGDGPTGAVPSTASPVRKPQAPSALDPAAREREYARMQKMLDAQLVGIRMIESDLARHSSALNQLRSQLHTVRGRQAGARSGGVRIERVGGESTLVDRAAEAREIEAKIKVEEPLVAQWSKALQEARQQYAALQRSMAQLLEE